LIIDEPLCWKSETIQRIGHPVGIVFVKIVGKRFYEGNIQNESHLEREPQNKHDSNAIKVVETINGTQVGHVERLSARGLNAEFFLNFLVLSPLMEKHICKTKVSLLKNNKFGARVAVKLFARTDIDAFQVKKELQKACFIIE
jgi:hypothetical protein